MRARCNSVAIAAVLLGEALRPLDLLGVAVIAAGILAVQLARIPQVDPKTVEGSGPDSSR
jgi:drug/metabolite transporter (DMT)-like permease